MQIVRYHAENLRAFLANHWAMRLLVVPILFLASLVALYALLSGNTGTTAATIVGGYLAISLGAVVVALVLEAVVRALTGGSLLGP